MRVVVVAIITRKSSRDEHKVSVMRQEAMGREWAEAFRPGVPVEVFEDNATSGVVMDRPGWVAFTQAVKAGVITDVWTYEQSRLTRAGGGAWDDVCALLSAAGIREVHTTRQGAISVVEGDRVHGRINSVMDQHEREVLRVRTLDGLKHAAADGKPGAATGYGYKRTYDESGRPVLEPDEEQVPHVRAMVQAVADGDSLGVIAARLNELGVPTANGAKVWRREAVRAIVSAPRIVGLRVHQARVVGPAKWEAIVDRATWERAQARLMTMRPGTVASKRRQYLLTGGLAACAACGTPLISGTTLLRGERLPSYQCPHPSRVENGCGKCSILADRLEDHVTELVWKHLTDPAYLDAINDLLRAGAVDTRPIHAELEHVEGLMADLAVRHANEEVIEVEYAAERRTLAERRQALLGQLAHAPVEEITIDRLLAAWEHGGISRRPIIPLLVETPILVRGAFSDGHRLTVEDRVDLRFRD